LKRDVHKQRRVERDADFRGINAAASLKRVDHIEGDDDNTDFRGIDAAASLKLRNRVARVWDGSLIRGSTAATSLKLFADGARVDRVVGIFHGITAAVSLKQRVSIVQTTVEVQIFRGITAAASLKLASETAFYCGLASICGQTRSSAGFAPDKRHRSQRIQSCIQALDGRCAQTRNRPRLTAAQ
jgi:hypothetical protein